MNTPHASVETITPDTATKWLMFNTHNRHLDKTRTRLYADAMRRGEWDGHSQFVFSQEGVLLDGQHRLAAVVASGQTITGVVLRGAPMTAQETIDTGKARSFGNVLAIRGEANYHSLAAATKVLWKIQNGTMRDNKTATHHQLSAVLEANPSLRDHLSFPGAKVIRGVLGVPHGLLAALSYVFSSVDEMDARVFFDHLASGADLSEGDPIYALRKRLETAQRTKKTAPVRPAVVAAWIIKAWNAWQTGVTLTEIRWRIGGSAPEDFPTILHWDGYPDSMAG